MLRVTHLVNPKTFLAEYAELSELRGAAEDHSGTPGTQSEVATGGGGAAGEDRKPKPEPTPVADNEHPKWHPNYGGVKYVEEEDGDPEF